MKNRKKKNVEKKKDSASLSSVTESDMSYKSSPPTPVQSIIPQIISIIPQILSIMPQTLSIMPPNHSILPQTTTPLIELPTSIQQMSTLTTTPTNEPPHNTTELPNTPVPKRVFCYCMKTDCENCVCAKNNSRCHAMCHGGKKTSRHCKNC